MSLESAANEQATNANAQAEYLKVSSFLSVIYEALFKYLDTVGCYISSNLTYQPLNWKSFGANIKNFHEKYRLSTSGRFVIFTRRISTR